MCNWLSSVLFQKCLNSSFQIGMLALTIQRSKWNWDLGWESSLLSLLSTSWFWSCLKRFLTCFSVLKWQRILERRALFNLILHGLHFRILLSTKRISSPNSSINLFALGASDRLLFGMFPICGEGTQLTMTCRRLN